MIVTESLIRNIVKKALNEQANDEKVVDAAAKELKKRIEDDPYFYLEFSHKNVGKGWPREYIEVKGTVGLSWSGDVDVKSFIAYVTDENHNEIEVEFTQYGFYELSHVKNDRVFHVWDENESESTATFMYKGRIDI